MKACHDKTRPQQEAADEPEARPMRRKSSADRPPQARKKDCSKKNTGR
jgi:hypothetical protein